MTGQEMFDALGETFAEKIQSKTEFRGETTYTIAGGIYVKSPNSVATNFSVILLDITSIDNHGEEPGRNCLFIFTHAAHLSLCD